MKNSPECPTIVSTDLGAYKRNIRKIKDFIGKHVRLMTVVKANAYGHGMVECSRAALDAGASMLGVAFASEGTELREAGITAPILVMTSELYENFAAMIDNNLTICITSFEMLNALNAALLIQNPTILANSVFADCAFSDVMVQSAEHALVTVFRMRTTISSATTSA